MKCCQRKYLNDTKYCCPQQTKENPKFSLNSLKLTHLQKLHTDTLPPHKLKCKKETFKKHKRMKEIPRKSIYEIQNSYNK